MYGFKLSSPQSSAADFTTAYLFTILYLPTTWSGSVNNDIYPLVALILQIAQAHNITIDGGAKYNVPSTVDKSFLNGIGAAAPANLTSYSTTAISGADTLVDDSVTIKDVFDVIVNITREVTPTCEAFIIRSHPFVLLTHSQSSRKLLASAWVCARRYISSGCILTTTSTVMTRINGRFLLSSGFRHPTPSSSRSQSSSSGTASVHSTLKLIYSVA